MRDPIYPAVVFFFHTYTLGTVEKSHIQFILPQYSAHLYLILCACVAPKR